MNINFSDYFKKESRDKLGIKEEMVRNAIQNPHETQTIEFKGLVLTFYLSKVKDNNMILILTKSDNNTINIEHALLIRKDLTKAIELKKPISILQELAEKFGLIINVGSYRGKFLFQEVIKINPAETTSLVKIENPDNHSFTQSMYLKISKEGLAECALAFALDTDKYLQWIKNPI